MMAVEDMDVLNAVTKVLYPTVAKKFIRRQRAAWKERFAMRLKWHGAEENEIHLMNCLDTL